MASSRGGGVGCVRACRGGSPGGWNRSRLWVVAFQMRSSQGQHKPHDIRLILAGSEIGTAVVGRVLPGDAM
ncbi:hypothetical protein L1987_74697 [Smallanthus sonchifolius]|uniref:Uncharacterized protein n=1 Tax=Smallanthus sonchifolius TaxID=185202 RepID=A0ACB9A426_9ASTR|nr:hypothetical protein L1987_74697 [Smallanthus sonchifolius]